MLASLALGLRSLRSNAPRPAARPLDRRPSPPGPAAGPVDQRAIQRVGLVRFNPYHDTGGEYSFSVALLDENGTGLLLTGLYHRDQSRVYAKDVRNWTSDQELMDEERQAVEQARNAEPG